MLLDRLYVILCFSVSYTTNAFPAGTIVCGVFFARNTEKPPHRRSTLCSGGSLGFFSREAGEDGGEYLAENKGKDVEKT